MIVRTWRTKTAPAVFYKLRHVRKGEIVKVERSDGKVVKYKVDGVEQVHKDSFPLRRVYVGDGLKLVTCGRVRPRRRRIPRQHHRVRLHA